MDYQKAEKYSTSGRPSENIVRASIVEVPFISISQGSQEPSVSETKKCSIKNV